MSKCQKNVSRNKNDDMNFNNWFSSKFYHYSFSFLDKEKLNSMPCQSNDVNNNNDASLRYNVTTWWEYIKD